MYSRYTCIIIMKEWWDIAKYKLKALCIEFSSIKNLKQIRRFLKRSWKLNYNFYKVKTMIVI